MAIHRLIGGAVASTVAAFALTAAPAAQAAQTVDRVDTRTTNEITVNKIIKQQTGAPATLISPSTTGLAAESIRARSAGTRLPTLVQQGTDGYSVLAVLSIPSQRTVRFDELFPTGSTLQLRHDGGIDVRVGHRSVASVAAPWAVDAAGRHLPTSYAIDGQSVVQQVDLRGATFPVVADPHVSVGHKYGVPVLYFQYTWSEMWKLKNRLDAGQAISNLACSVSGPAKAACVIVVNHFASKIRSQVQSGIRHKKCLKMRLPLYPTGVTMFLFGTSLVHCRS